ncbi:MAG: hypothetical protein Q4A58_06415 [Fusobacterium sp.]|uniref:hypothetical protein n=1 Tax=Fusobacterium sp. TaxID=68766 RepID=UPI0026DDB8BE|nr:hypothetical protein [Fusobacterium sp.]MDO4690909.1 hypothetical protein [Fusobacterium sp.]
MITKVKRVIVLIFLLIFILIVGVFLAKDFIMKEILQRKLSKINNAPVYIENVFLSPLDNYIVIKDIKISSTVNKDSQFIKIDEFKSYYNVDYSKKRVTFSDTEIENMVFFENIEPNDIKISNKNDIFSDRITEAEENFKRDQVLNELKSLYLEKIDIDSVKIDEAIKEKYANLETIKQGLKSDPNFNDLDDIKDSLKKIRDVRRDNISEVLNEISKIGKSSKNIAKNMDLEKIKFQFNELRKGEQFKEILNEIVKDFLNKNKFILQDLDSYINLYLNTVYEQKIYEFYLKYLKLVNEIDRRKFLENIQENKDDWELYFDSISLTSNMYGINFNGEIKDFSSKITENKNNISFKLFGEKGQTIGELRGYINFQKYQTEMSLNVPELNSVDFNNRTFIAGEAAVNQYVYTDNEFLHTEGKIYFKNLKLNGEELAKTMKIGDDLIRELVIPILSELKGGEVSYTYDTRSRKLILKTDFADIFEKIINDENSSLKVKMREKIKEEYLNKFLN